MKIKNLLNKQSFKNKKIKVQNFKLPKSKNYKMIKMKIKIFKINRCKFSWFRFKNN